MTTSSAPENECAHTAHGYISDKSRYLARLKRIEGQARGIHRMVDEEQYCIDILTQISALTKAQNQTPFLVVNGVSIAADKALQSGKLDILDVRIEVSSPIALTKSR